MDAETFRREAHRVADWIADYLADPSRYPVLAQVAPGDVRKRLPAEAPQNGESFDAIFADFEKIIMPGVTHWNHPGFFAYFAITGSAPGVLAEFLAAALNQQAMLWRTSPSATELEELVLRWLQRLMHLPDAFEGVIYDTASISTLHALAAARERTVPDVRKRGLAGREGLGRFRVYCSDQTHSSIDKAVILLGLGHEALRNIPTRRRLSHAHRRAARCDRRGPSAGHHADGRRRDDWVDVNDQRGSVARDRRPLPRARDLAARRRRVCGCRRDGPGLRAPARRR